MEDALVHIKKWMPKSMLNVLILVVMEDALVLKATYRSDSEEFVLILVVMEDALVQLKHFI